MCKKWNGEIGFRVYQASKSKDKLRYWCRFCDTNANSTWNRNNRTYVNKCRREKFANDVTCKLGLIL